MSNTTDLKQLNISSVLSTLYREKELTKTELAKKIKLSSVTAHNLINELKLEGVVIETGDFLHGAGRKAVKYKLNDGYALSIGVHFFRYSLEIAVCDFSLNLVYEKRVGWDMKSLSVCLKTLKEELLLVLKTFSDKKFLGVGVSVPGRVDKNGVIIELPDRKEWNGINIKREIEEYTALEVFADNDVNAEAISVKWTEDSGECQNFAYLCTNDGTGASVVMNGQIFHGYNHFGPEIGHITVVKGGRLCECGKKGCLQAYTSNSAILSWAKCLGNEISDIEVLTSLYDRDDEIRKILDKACEYFALAVEYLIRAFDPEKIIIKSLFLSSEPLLLEIVKRNVYAGLGTRANFASIELGNMDEKASKCAPCCLVLNDFYASN